jgi:hypothetical protein
VVLDLKRGRFMEHYLGPQRLLEVDGDAERRARQQGLACASQYASAASCIGSLVVEPRWVGARVHTRVSQAGLAAAGAYYLARHRSALRTFDGGRFWRAQEGLAEGAGLPMSLSFGLGAVPELVGSQLGYALGCSAVAVARVEGERGPKIFYNHDFPPRFGRYSFVRRNAPSDGHASVCLTYPIMVGCLAGVNEPGLAVTLNHAFAKDYHGRAGILLTSLVQACLDRAGDVEAALDLLRSAPVTNGAILTLADRRGARAVVEVSCTAIRVRRPTELVACSFNRYQHPDMAAFEIPERAVSTGLVPGIVLHESNVARHARWAELVPEQPASVTEPDIRRWMTDRRGGEGDKNTICRHDDPLSETLWTAVLSPEDRAVDVSFGHACEGKPVRYALARVPVSAPVHAAHAPS